MSFDFFDFSRPEIMAGPGDAGQVLGYRPNEHAQVWIHEEPTKALWLVTTYANYGDAKLYAQFTSTVTGTVIQALDRAYVVTLAVQHQPDLAAFEQMCQRVLDMQRNEMSSTIRLFRKQ